MENKLIKYLMLLVTTSIILHGENITHKSNSIVSFGIDNTITSRYIPKSGTQIGKGSANQTLLFSSYKNIVVYYWINYGFPDRFVTEWDYGFTISKPIIDKFINGNVKGTIGYHKWNFPIFNLDTHILEGSIDYIGSINLKNTITYIVKDSKNNPGTRIHIDLSKFITNTDKYDIKMDISSVIHFKFYNMNDYAFITPSLGMIYKFDHFYLAANINYQFSSNNINFKDSKNFLYLSISLGK